MRDLAVQKTNPRTFTATPITGARKLRRATRDAVLVGALPYGHMRAAPRLCALLVRLADDGHACDYNL